GGLYDPVANAWRPTTTAGAPGARREANAVWTGTEMIVWGGRDANGYLGTGARYDPAGDAWTPITLVNAPPPRPAITAIWSGKQMIVHGGGIFGLESRD